MNATRRFWGIVAIGLVLTIVPAATAKYRGGSGTADDPYQIATAADLIALGETPEDYDKHFILTADIDLDPNLPGGKVFDRAVIAPDTEDAEWWFQGTAFTGVFDGNGHKVSHLTIVGTSFLGLFGQLGSQDSHASQVENLGMVDVNVIGSGYPVGSLVGCNWNCSIAMSYSTGSVSGSSSVGGLVGYNLSRIATSYSSGSVSGDSKVGGLVGSTYGGLLSRCYSICSVTGISFVGGLLGDNMAEWGVDYYAGSILQCYSAGPVKGHSYVGGLVGSGGEGWALSCFWDTQASGQATSAGGTGLTTAAMQDRNTFVAAGWEFAPHDIWFEPAGGGYPVLWWQLSPWPSLPTFSGGTGQADDPYLISTAEDLNSIGYNPRLMNCHFELLKNLDLTCIEFYPIGGPSFPYAGVFDGNGHTVSHLTVTGGDYAGLFGYLGSAGKVKDLAVVNVNVTGSVGWAGGLAAFNLGFIINCCSSGSVSVNGAVGGLVGYNLGRIATSYSSGSVSGDSYVGGLVGCNDGGISNCYSSGSVSGKEYWVGGLVGLSTWGSRIATSYSSGSVIGHSGSVGGLMGGIRGDVVGCFWDTETSGQAMSGGGMGKTTAEMQTASTFLEAGWDFVGETANGTEDIWKIAEGLDYPRLWWEPYDGRVTVVLGQVFTVTLESNPSTGYRWEWVDHQDSIVEQMGEAQFKPRETGDPPPVGAGGWESFDFKAVHPGQMTLTLVYRRPWEQGLEPVKTFSLQVTVP